MTAITRQERRAERRRGSVTAREARLAARLAGLDYKTSGETGALKVPSKARTWHLGGRVNGHAPPPGRMWDRSGATYVTGYAGAKLRRPIIHHRWRRLTAEQMADSTTE